ncbi:hypothetical protein [Streptomyces sennicomposti]
MDIDEAITALRRTPAQVGAEAARCAGPSPARVADRLTATARHTADRPAGTALL